MAQNVRKPGLSEVTFYAYRSKYAGVSVAELALLKRLKKES